jgi:hypothetical protein
MYEFQYDILPQLTKLQRLSLSDFEEITSAENMEKFPYLCLSDLPNLSL